MKRALLLAMFLVSWSEEYLQPRWENGDPLEFIWKEPSYYTVETTTHSIKLATQRDVAKFVGRHEYLSEGTTSYWIPTPPLIPANAFNITVKDISEDVEQMRGLRK